MSYDDNRISDQIEGGLKTKEDQQLLDHFAGLAMQGILTHFGFGGSDKYLAERTYKVAEEMMKERERRLKGV